MQIKLDCAQKVQTFTKAGISTKSDLGFEYRLIQIWSSAASLPKCSGFILSSVSVISPSIAKKSAGGCMRDANKSPKIHFWNGEGNGYVIWNPYMAPDHHQKLISSFDR